MRLFSTLAFLLINLCLYGQATFGVNPETKLLTAEEVLKLDSLSADQIYKKCKEWITLKRKHHDYDNVEVDEPTLIKFNYVSKYYGVIMEGPYWNVLTIQIKEGRAKITINNITSGDRILTIEKMLFKSDGTLKTAKMYSKVYEDIQNKTPQVIAEIKAHILKKDNW